MDNTHPKEKSKRIVWNKGLKGIYKTSEETKKKLSKIHLGKKLSEEHKRKISEIRKKKFKELGYLNSEETRKKISESGKGRKSSEESKIKRSKTAKQKGIGKWMKGRKLSEETRKKMRLSAKRGEKNPAWKGGISFEPYTIDWTETLKRSIRERDKYTCQICGKEPSVITHHIDYDKENCNPNNLIILCVNCHTKTNHNRDYWTQLIREIRNKK